MSVADVRALKSPTRGSDLAIKGWRGFVTKALADKAGILAEIIVAEAVQECGLDDGNLRLSQLNRFMAVLYTRLPDEMDRRAFIIGLQGDVLRRLFANLRRDLEKRLTATRPTK